MVVGAQVDGPQCTTGWWRHGAAGAAVPWLARLELTGAPHYMDMVLCFHWFLFLRNWWGARNSPRWSSTGGGLWSRTCNGKVQASSFGDGGGMLQGPAHDKVGPNGCSAERRTIASSRWSSRSVARGVATKGANLGFVSIFFEIPMQLPSIYRGFGFIISCVCRALSPSFPIGLGFDILTGFIEILVSSVFVSVATQCGVGDDQCWAAPGPHVSEAGVGSAGPVGRNLAHGQ
jgi:hypothetical protein